MRPPRPLLIAVSVVFVLGVGLLVGRWLNADSVERGKVEALLHAQARGDATAMLSRVDCPDARCRAQLRANARRLKTSGDVKIARYDSKSSHALGSTTKPTRVVWFTSKPDTMVQCILVRREGGVLSGPSVTLLRVSAPIERESSCK